MRRRTVVPGGAASAIPVLRPDAIFAVTHPAAQVALAATKSVPIVFTAVADPVGWSAPTG